MSIKSVLSVAVPICLAAAIAGPSIADTAPTLEIVESVPVETTLDHPGIPQAADVWLEMIRGAARSIDIESFYYSDDPADDDDPLDRVLDAVGDAARRGVKVRLIGDAGFHRTYPEILDRFGAMQNVESRLLDARSLWGGVQHAKFMIIDGTRAYVGSQNWDWRALMHIHEIGARITHPDLSRAVGAIFDLDWALAGGSDPTGGEYSAGPFQTGPASDPCSVRLAASPPSALPRGIPHDEPMLIDLIDRAETRVRLQLLSYNPSERDGTYYGDLDQALRRAASRGVEVRIILSNWAKRSYMLPHIKSLAVLKNVEVRFTNIPEWSGGFVPYARVEHPKYLVRDAAEAWLGTANWARDYFRESRNLSLFISGGRPVRDLGEVFDLSWNSLYAETVDPCAKYTPPRREE